MVGSQNLIVTYSLHVLIFLTLQAITSSGTKKGDMFLADVNTQLKNKNITTDVKVDTNSNVSDLLCLVISVTRIQ